MASPVIHPLPPRPSTAAVTGTGAVAVAAAAGPSRLPSSSLSATTKTATTDPTQCSICCSTAKYTCPRCSSRTCSLPCSKTHKSSTGCSGQRDPAKFVPLKEYGQGAWAGDYVYLEEGRRKVSNWGNGVKVEEITPNSRYTSGPTRGRGRGRGGSGTGHGGGRQRRSKVDILGNELAKVGCQVSFMPEGMARRKANQSGYNPKTQQIHISIQLSIPKHLLDPSVTASPSESKITMHPRNLLSTNASPTLHSLLPSSLSPADLIFVLPFHATPSRAASASESQSQTQPDKPGQKLFFPPLDGTKPLGTALKGTGWIEFPTVFIYSKTAWETSVDKGEVGIVPLLDIAVKQSEGQCRDDGWAGKRRADNVDNEGQGAKADADSDPRPVKKAKVADEGLLALGEYDSEEEDDGGQDDRVDDAEAEGESGEEDQEEDLEVAPAQEAEDAEDAEDAEEDEPSLEVLQAVGMAIAADFG